MREHRIKTLEELTYLLSGSSFTFISGVWDGVHSGHTRAIEKASGFNDFLVVGIHSDDMSEKRKKRRPKFPELDRAEVVTHFPFVDYVIILENQDHLFRTIRELKPKVLVVSTTSEGPDNSAENMQRLFGKKMKVEVLPAMSPYHSSDDVKK